MEGLGWCQKLPSPEHVSQILGPGGACHSPLLQTAPVAKWLLENPECLPLFDRKSGCTGGRLQTVYTELSPCSPYPSPGGGNPDGTLPAPAFWPGRRRGSRGSLSESTGPTTARPSAGPRARSRGGTGRGTNAPVSSVPISALTCEMGTSRVMMREYAAGAAGRAEKPCHVESLGSGAGPRPPG